MLVDHVMRLTAMCGSRVVRRHRQRLAAAPSTGFLLPSLGDYSAV